MKLCAISEYDLNHDINIKNITSCISFSESIHPQQNLILDWISFSIMSLFIVLNLFFVILFLILKYKQKISTTLKDVYLICIFISSSLHIISIFMTYGFFWPALQLGKTCSLWSFWLQWFLGFSIWISILSIRIYSLAQTTIPKLMSITENPKIIMIHRILLFVFMISIMLLIGIIAESTFSFSIDEHGHCSTNFWIKLSILIWLVLSILFLMILSYLIKKNSLISDNEHIVNIELKIIKFTWPILLICILLNFSGLTSYAFSRFLFLMLIISIHACGGMILYTNQVILYYFNNQFIIAVFDLFDINIPSKYFIISPSHTDDYDDKKLLSQESLTDIEMYSMTSIESDLNDNDYSSSLLLNQNNPLNYNLTSLNDNLNFIDEKSVSSRKKIIDVIKKDDESLNIFLDKLIAQCIVEENIIQRKKMIQFDYFNTKKDQVTSFEIPLQKTIQLLKEINLLFNDISIVNISDQEFFQKNFISKLKHLLSVYITSEFNSSIDIAMASSSTEKIDQNLELRKLKNLEDISKILFFLHGNYETDLSVLNNIQKMLRNFYSMLKDKIINDFYSFWEETEGLKDLREAQHKKKRSMSMYNNDMSNHF